MSNLKQIALAWQLYTDDSNDRLARNGAKSPTLIDDEPLWVPGTEHPNLEAFTNNATLLDPKIASFANYVKSPEVYLCPSDRRFTYILADNAAQRRARPPRNRSYSLNVYAGAVPGGAGFGYISTNGVLFQKSSDFSRGSPSDIFTFADVNPGSICMPAFVVRIPGMPADRHSGFFHFPATYHNKAGDLAFADGHVETHRWKDPTTFQEAGPGGFVIHQGFPDDNSDLTWLRQKTTFPQQ